MIQLITFFWWSLVTNREFVLAKLGKVFFLPALDSYMWSIHYAIHSVPKLVPLTWVNGKIGNFTCYMCSARETESKYVIIRQNMSDKCSEIVSRLPLNIPAGVVSSVPFLPMKLFIRLSYQPRGGCLWSWWPVETGWVSFGSNQWPQNGRGRTCRQQRGDTVVSAINPW